MRNPRTLVGKRVEANAVALRGKKKRMLQREPPHKSVLHKTTHFQRASTGALLWSGISREHPSGLAGRLRSLCSLRMRHCTHHSDAHTDVCANGDEEISFWGGFGFGFVLETRHQLAHSRPCRTVPMCAEREREEETEMRAEESCGFYFCAVY